MSTTAVLRSEWIKMRSVRSVAGSLTAVLVVTLAIQQLIREGKSFQIPGAITMGKRLGMQLMDQSLLALVRAGEVDPDEAFLRAEDKWGFAPFVTRPELLALMTGGGEGKAA